MKRLWIILTALMLTGCEYEEVKREIGYKGPARINPWLAAERFVQRDHGELRSLTKWATPGGDDAVWFVPASLLENEVLTRRLENWVTMGGHLVLMLEHASAATSDWSTYRPRITLEEPLKKLLAKAEIEVSSGKAEALALDDDAYSSEEIEFQEEIYQVDAKSQFGVCESGGEPGVFASVESGSGRLTVVTDGRLFRNRWIGDKDHAALLESLIFATEREGKVGFLRGGSSSLWRQVFEKFWPVLLGLGLLILLWLWKSFARFGPMESAAEGTQLRGYDHHLEALGDFQWRLDRAATLLAPLRKQVTERGQRLSQRAGRGEEGFYQFLADRASMPREQVCRAMGVDAKEENVAKAPDSLTLTLIVSDLQQLLKVLH